MTESDLDAVTRISERVHVAYPEDAAVLAERQKLYPPGCKVFDSDGRVDGYVLSHPWRHLDPPSLNVALGALPPEPTTFYIHDIVLLPEARGSGAASAAVRELVALARATGFDNMSLVALKGTSGFWKRHGFVLVSDPALDRKLTSYDEHARYMVRRL
jgi:ribosomal protein S18 acetylase RimI-like enzyme